MIVLFICLFIYITESIAECDLPCNEDVGCNEDAPCMQGRINFDEIYLRTLFV